MTEKELRELLDCMGLQEKVNQLLQVTTGFFDEGAELTGPVREGGITEESVEQAGSVIGLLGARRYRELQEKYLKKQPHGIPLLVMLDVINGFRTIYPIPLGLSAAFEPELASRCARMAAREAAVSGVHVTFSPMADLVRDARWGRVMEGSGEDPKLSCDYAAAAVKGYQGERVGDKDRIAACVKHFAGYGAPVAGRDYNTVELSENTLRGYYLPAYKAAVKAGAEMVMTSFNTLNGIPSTGNRSLLRETLRGEMGFEGVLISDWAAIEEMIVHGYAEDRKEAARLALEAGVDIDMMTGIYSKELPELLEKGEIPSELLDEAVFRVLCLKNKLGLFENPLKDADEEREKEEILCGEHRRLAREAAEKSFVLLENDGILPLKKGEKAAFIGPFTEERELYGAWSMLGRPEDTVSIREAAEALGEEYEFTFAQGCPILGEGEARLIPDSCMYFLPKTDEDELLDEAVKLAQNAHKVVLSLGEHRCMSGEAASRAELRIPQVQLRLLEAVYRVNPRIAVVLFTGRPLDIREIRERSRAVLNVWMPGTEGGTAILNVLTGQRAPEGRLPMSFPYCAGQTPVYYNEYFTGRPYRDGEEDRVYKSNYRDIPNAPLYPFGYGRTYASFSYSDRTISADSMRGNEVLRAGVRIANTGNCEGTETVQLYLRDCAGSVVRPKKELKDYRKVTLKPGEETEAVFTITEEMLRFCRADGTWGSEKGRFEVFIGGDSTVEDGMGFVLL